MTLQLVQPHPFTRDEALAELAGFIGDEFVEVAYARRVATPFNAKPSIERPDEDCPEPHVTTYALAWAIADAEKLAVPGCMGRKRYYRRVLAALRGEAFE